MSRRPDPQRIDDARRAALYAHLTGAGMPEATAEAWVARWEDRAASDGRERDAGYWTAGREWIAEQRRLRVGP